MRKYKKRQLLDILCNMKEAEGVLKGLFENQEKEQVHILLTDMQQAAMEIGMEIEQTEGEDSTLVHMLEEYCELVFKCSEEKDTKAQDMIYRFISKSREEIQKYLEENIEEQLEIVFLPYKASMWDSLESIWNAAKEDKKCNAHVIMIPYFDKDKEGKPKKINYEADLMPEYVPITDYRYYDLQEMHPDIIYFHNPYDQFNYVTSVHPDYYSLELKKCTDMLVYIPYFVCVDNVEEDLCSAPGIFRADRVIVESEKVRQTYIKVYMEMLGKKENGEATKQESLEFEKRLKQSAKEKYVVLGSPKYDKVMNTRRESVVLPQKWESLIVTKDGTRKTVILYNTTISTILKQKEKMIEKLEFVLNIFREQEDIVLLWRPHPLSVATLETLAWELCNRYQNIVENYKQEGWGIYDESPDLNRAIAISDAYYGDMSSVVALYKVTGKPIMIQNMEVKD